MFLLWMLSELFETLPEVGDGDKPKFVFFFDEAHLLFNGMPKELLDKIVQVVKLIRSKGVGVYFITQSPSDIPDEVLAQLSNRIQHGLRAYTPAEQKAVKAAAQSFRENPAFNAKDKILELGTGEALISFLDEEGKPSIVEYAKILPPQCRMAAADPEVIDRVLACLLYTSLPPHTRTTSRPSTTSPYMAMGRCAPPTWPIPSAFRRRASLARPRTFARWATSNRSATEKSHLRPQARNTASTSSCVIACCAPFSSTPSVWTRKRPIARRA